ncbi:MAG: hypothetical protein LUI39_06660 [Lachnospiraceae bacterium]|nr:hypothetical protein [Lachnospiraceae bacterium]
MSAVHLTIQLKNKRAVNKPCLRLWFLLVLTIQLLFGSKVDAAEMEVAAEETELIIIIAGDTDDISESETEVETESETEDGYVMVWKDFLLTLSYENYTGALDISSLEYAIQL